MNRYHQAHLGQQPILTANFPEQSRLMLKPSISRLTQALYFVLLIITNINACLVKRLINDLILSQELKLSFLLLVIIGTLQIFMHLWKIGSCENAHDAYNMEKNIQSGVFVIIYFESII